MRAKNNVWVRGEKNAIKVHIAETRFTRKTNKKEDVPVFATT